MNRRFPVSLWPYRVLAGLVLGIGIATAGPAAHAATPDPNPATLHSTGGAWPLYRQWNAAELGHYAHWVERLFDVKWRGSRTQRLAKLEAVLTDPEANLLLDPAFAGEPSNPQIDPGTLRSVHPVLDCGKLTVVLGAYYAYRRGLPWMGSRIRSGDGTDIRTSGHNVPSGNFTCRDYGSAHSLIVDAVCGFCTGNYRVNPTDRAAERSDTVPVAIDRRYLMPGALFYLDGHVLILAKIDPYGGLRFLDATTSSTRDIYTHNALNAVTGITPRGEGQDPYAGCYRGFRIYRFPIAETDSTGKVTRVRGRTDEEMRAFGYSLEQYDKMGELVRTGHIREAGLSLDTFHDFVRLRLRTASEWKPFERIAAAADRMLALAQAREVQVRAGWADTRAHGAIAFPEGRRDANIYNASGRWGEFASTMIDTELREEYFDLVNDLESAVSWFRIQPDFIALPDWIRRASWGPNDLAMLLAGMKDRIFAGRTFRYTNSAGKPVTLSLLDVERRIFDLSFDPNHPPELRWGAPEGSRERATAIATATPAPKGEPVPMLEAYQRQAYYRTLTYRDIEESELRNAVTAGFPTRSTLAPRLAMRWKSGRVPPLMPHGWHMAGL